jgi:hypothetical protein
MDLLDNKSDEQLLLSIVGELAKSKNELACARGDLEKINSRISFLLVLANKMIERQKD